MFYNLRAISASFFGSLLIRIYIVLPFNMGMKINSVYWIIFHIFLPAADFFQSELLKKKIFQEYHQFQTVWIQIRLDIFLGLIWVQIVCKDYKQTTLVGKELKTK